MSDTAGLLILFLSVAVVTICCLVAARRVYVPPRSDDPAASRLAQRKAMAQRDALKGKGLDPFGR